MGLGWIRVRVRVENRIIYYYVSRWKRYSQHVMGILKILFFGMTTVSLNKLLSQHQWWFDLRNCWSWSEWRLKKYITLRYLHRCCWQIMAIDAVDEMRWWELWDVGDSFGNLVTNIQTIFYISVGHQHSKIVTKFRSPTLMSPIWLTTVFIYNQAV